MIFSTFLLQRPWQCDVNAQQSKRSNTYCIEKERGEVCSIATKSKMQKDETCNILTITKEFKMEVKETRHIPCLGSETSAFGGTKASSGWASQLVQLVSKEFKDLMTEAVQNGLPPICGIQNHIDFIPCASLLTLLDESKGEWHIKRQKWINSCERGLIM